MDEVVDEEDSPEEEEDSPEEEEDSPEEEDDSPEEEDSSSDEVVEDSLEEEESSIWITTGCVVSMKRGLFILRLSLLPPFERDLMVTSGENRVTFSRGRFFSTEDVSSRSRISRELMRRALLIGRKCAFSSLVIVSSVILVNKKMSTHNELESSNSSKSWLPFPSSLLLITAKYVCIGHNLSKSTVTRLM